MTEHSCDVAIFGGGIAGLWALHILKAQGYQPILIEKETLGGAQTLAAQGILHGGMKYALDGKVDDIALRLREMPARWLDSMAGKGEVDLASARVESPQQVMWSDGSLLSRLSGALGSNLLKGDVDTLSEAEWPEIFRANAYRGSVRVLKETVIDTKSVIQALAAPVNERLYQADNIQIVTTGDRIDGVRLSAGGGDPVLLKAGTFIFTAGAGNELPASLLPFEKPATQKRPLKQIVIRGVPWKLWGHCIVADPKPRVTVTSHTMPDGEGVWYLGGNVAERAASMSDKDAINFARKEMSAIFPKTDWGKFGWGVWPVDRAEPHQSSRFIPAEPTIKAVGNCLLAWPTKLVFAPGLATKLAQEVSRRLTPGAEPPASLPLPRALVGRYPWECITDWRTA